MAAPLQTQPIMELLDIVQLSVAQAFHDSRLITFLSVSDKFRPVRWLGSFGRRPRSYKTGGPNQPFHWRQTTKAGKGGSDVNILRKLQAGFPARSNAGDTPNKRNSANRLPTMDVGCVSPSNEEHRLRSPAAGTIREVSRSAKWQPRCRHSRLWSF